jgi:hypothetical protein
MTTTSRIAFAADAYAANWQISLDALDEALSIKEAS